jgi:hypothetical protein
MICVVPDSSVNLDINVKLWSCLLISSCINIGTRLIKGEWYSLKLSEIMMERGAA